MNSTLSDDNIMDAFELLDSYEIDGLSDEEVEEAIQDVIDEILPTGTYRQQKELYSLLSNTANRRIHGVDELFTASNR